MEISCRLPHIRLLSFVRLKFYDLKKSWPRFWSGDEGLDFDGDTMRKE
jgi:hypothetical protein